VDLLPVDADGVAREPAHALLVLTGGTEAQALAFAGRARGPLLLLSHGTHNSLAAALETAARLRADGRKAHLVHLGAEAKEALPVWAQAVGLARKLRGQRVGLVGDPSPWLVASSPDPALLREKLGIEVVLLPLEAVLERPPPEAADLPIGEGVEIGEEARAMGARVHAALRRLVEEERLDALTIACFGLLPHRMTACWALACLADAGVPAGCEGDLPALLGLMVAQELTDGPGFLANPADVDLKLGTLTLAHCTVPLALTRSHVLRTHFESGLGLAVAGELRPGPYTLVRFGGRDLAEGFFVEGTVLDERVGREDLCRTQVRFKMPRGALERLLREPLGNHHVLVPGHHRAVLTQFAELCLAGAR
jgi:L-fucose isomerase-like protein